MTNRVILVWAPRAFLGKGASVSGVLMTRERPRTAGSRCAQFKGHRRKSARRAPRHEGGVLQIAAALWTEMAEALPRAPMRCHKLPSSCAAATDHPSSEADRVICAPSSRGSRPETTVEGYCSLFKISATCFLAAHMQTPQTWDVGTTTFLLFGLSFNETSAFDEGGSECVRANAEVCSGP